MPKIIPNIKTIIELDLNKILNIKIDKVIESYPTQKNTVVETGKIKNIINISNIDLENMNAKNIKIISISKDNNFFYLAKKGKLKNKREKIICKFIDEICPQAITFKGIIEKIIELINDNLFEKKF